MKSPITFSEEPQVGEELTYKRAKNLNVHPKG